MAETNKTSSCRILLMMILQHNGRPVVKHVELSGLRRQRLLLQQHSNLIDGLLLHSSDPPVEMAVVHPLLQHSDPNAEGVYPPITVF